MRPILVDTSVWRRFSAAPPWALLRRLPLAPQVSDEEVLALIRHRRLMRKGIGWVDASLLASALVGSSALWTLDRSFADVVDSLKLTPTLR